MFDGAAAPDPEFVYLNYLETCLRLGIEPVPRERASIRHSRLRQAAKPYRCRISASVDPDRRAARGNAALRWSNVDFRWKKLTIADKVDTTRVISLTPYVAWLLSNLPRKNEFVFANDKSKSGRLSEPRSPHAEVLADAGIPHVSIHGLLRTFSLLGEAAGAIAQVMGHRPSALAEGYRPRSIDALRPLPGADRGVHPQARGRRFRSLQPHIAARGECLRLGREPEYRACKSAKMMRRCIRWSTIEPRPMEKFFSGG